MVNETNPPDEANEGGDSKTRQHSLIGWIGRGLVSVLLAIVLVGMWAWCVLAIHFSNLPGQTLRSAAAAVFALGWVAIVVLFWRRKHKKWWFLASFMIIAVWYWFIPASNDRDWIPEYAKMAHADIDGDRVTIHNIRNSTYRSATDFDVHYHDKTYDLNDLETVDFVCSSWGVKDVIHTLFTFGFRGGDHIVLSIETRRDKHDTEGTLDTIFKQYELIYILGTECDILRLRTNFRHENVYVFPTNTTPEETRTLFLAVLDQVNALYDHPRYYNLLTHNCTTGLIPMMRSIRPERYSWKVLLNAYTAEMAYDRKWLETPFSFKDTLQFFHANQYVKDHPECPGYSERIRPIPPKEG